MVLLMVVTIGYAPLVVPLAVEGATVDALAIAQSLVLFMLVPLGLGLFVRARYPELAEDWVGRAGHASTMGLLLGIGSALLLTWREVDRLDRDLDLRGGSRSSSWCACWAAGWPGSDARLASAC